MRFAVLGDPVAHSKSPAMHAAAYRALGLDHVYEKRATTAAELPARIAELRAGAYDGFNVTVPHKTHVLDLVDEVDDGARAIGAANTLVRTARGLRATNTDAPAIAAELARLGARLRGRRAVVLGSGGAARAAVVALRSAGAEVVVRARRPLPGFPHEPLAPPVREDDVAAIVQCTSAGMTGADPGEAVANAVAWATLPPDCVVYDVVYAPPRTPIVERAAARGLRNDTGLGMLVEQGALAFEAWLGVSPPRDVMRAAIEELT